jgi:hypothetical protein
VNPDDLLLKILVKFKLKVDLAIVILNPVRHILKKLGNPGSVLISKS